jgi:hypothetical protein
VKGKAIVKVYCNRCGDHTNHEIICLNKRRVEYMAARDDMDWDGVPVYIGEQYSVLSCLGCDDVCFRVEKDLGFYSTDDIGEAPFLADEQATQIYPPRLDISIQPTRLAPRWSILIPDVEVRELLDDVYKAIASRSPRLAAMAARALLERMMINTVGDRGRFKANLEAYAAHVGLGVSTRNAIDAVLGIGHAAIHRAVKIDDPLLEDVVDHLEHILQNTYILPERSKAIQQKTPPQSVPSKKVSSQDGKDLD